MLELCWLKNWAKFACGHGCWKDMEKRHYGQNQAWAVHPPLGLTTISRSRSLVETKTAMKQARDHHKSPCLGDKLGKGFLAAPEPPDQRKFLKDFFL